MANIRKFDLDKLELLVQNGEVTKNKHPTKDLYVYSYLLSWYPEWTEEHQWARGLVLDGAGNVIACPFKKFFNYGEVPAEIEKRAGMKYDIQDKMDGSLGILFWYQDEWILCTRGSFISEQAVNGRRILEDKYPEYVNLNRNYTYLFEIIYPENQIVINYGKEEKLVLLEIMNPMTMSHAVDNDHEKFGIPLATIFPIIKYIPKSKFDYSLDKIIEELKRPDYINSEGFVVKYEDGYRVKFKYEEYVRIHKTVTEVRPIRLVIAMSLGEDLKKLSETLPDEFRTEILSIKEKVETLFNEVNRALLTEYKLLRVENRKEFARNVISKFKDNKLFADGLFTLWMNEFTPSKKYDVRKKIHDVIFKILINQFEWK